MIQFWQAVRASYWFVPSIMVILALGLGALVVWLDRGPMGSLFNEISWYQQSKPDGAREVLSAIASSAITVAGVAFSITIVAISFAANQYGPRILTNFMSDRGNQFTLGTFIATFVYCIMVLRTIYGGESTFVPQIAIVVALGLALCSTGMLIYFIHHVPRSIHVNSVLAGIGRQLVDSIKEHFPARIGDPPDQSDEDREAFARRAHAAFSGEREWCEIDCQSTGYLQAVDNDKILSIACEHDLIIKLERLPGEFLYCGQSLFRVVPADRVTDHVRSELRDSWSSGSARTPTQDQMFLLDELVEIASRALSSGVNDPYTAITCADWLTAGAAELARRQTPSPFRLDEEEELRVVSPTISFDLHIARGFGRLRPYAARDINAAAHIIGQLAVLAGDCRLTGQVDTLASEAEALFDLASNAMRGPSLERLEQEMHKARADFVRSKSRLLGRDVEITGKAGSGSPTFAHTANRAHRIAQPVADSDG